MKVELDGLGRAVANFGKAIKFWGKDGQEKLRRAHLWAGHYWVAEMQKRCPVDEGRLRSSIRTNTYTDGQGGLTTEVGSNVQYAPHIEFGTKYIAGGRVKLIGLRPDVTDTMAIHEWPAKSGQATPDTSASIETQGADYGRRRNAEGQFVAGTQEQMPFLRPAWMAIRERVKRMMSEAMHPPPQNRWGNYY